ncbi:MAG: 16S rRNA (uracil(1498)-N(3))-methyltransferase [Treponema sp.]|nr:16S rRNA (uracil(1498)-N(3))-methyltransferase [Treponema sp.]
MFERDELEGPAAGTASLFRGTLSRRDGRAEHLLKVLHKKEGDSFDAGLVGGKLGTGTVTETGDILIRFTVDLNAGPPPRTPLRLVVGFPRPIQLRRLLRDCASLGLEAGDRAAADMGEKSYRDTKLLSNGGARAALLEGAAQGRDTRLPELAVYSNLAAWLSARPWARTVEAPGRKQAGDQAGAAETPEPGGLLLVAADNVRPEGSFAGLEAPAAGHEIAGGFRAVLAVGPERGWSDRERELLEQAGFRRLSMGSRALRTETACTAAVILLMEKLGCL